MPYTIDELAQEIGSEYGKDWTDSDNQAQVMMWVNRAYKEVVDYHDWWWLRREEDVTLAALDTTFSLSSASFQPLKFTITSPAFRPLKMVDVMQMHDVDTTITGTPEYCWIVGFGSLLIPFGLDFRIWPIPTDITVIHVDEVLLPTNLQSGSQIPVPENFINPIQNLTRMKLMGKDGNYKGAADARDEAYSQLDRMKIRASVPKARKLMLARTDAPNNQTDLRLPTYPAGYPDVE